MGKKIKCLIYCTKAKPYLIKGLEPFFNKDYWFLENKESSIDFYGNLKHFKDQALNGKVVAQFDCEKVERFDVPYPAYFWEVKDELEHITKGSCLSLMNLHHYLKNENGYAIHISKLEIFDKPKELSNYCIDLQNGFLKSLEKAPQNMMNVREWKKISEFYYKTYDYVLISIKPEWVEKILNGEKTIEVRKKILKAMEELI